MQTALRDIDSLGTQQDRHTITRAIARTVLATQYEVSRRKVAQTMQIDKDADLSTDDAILAEAVRATAAVR